ncbi:MAG TPA: sigma-70 family RNA polymerase sigma factor [Solirubrobacteraceae bacterium]
MTPLLSHQLLRTQSDGRLIALTAAGHDRAFEAIVDRYRRPLQRYLRRLLSEGLAEDVLQATFVRAWQALGSGTEVRDLRPWLYRIAHNQAINALRAASPALPDTPELVDTVGAAPTISTEGEVERREQLRQTLDGIGALPDRQRAALVAVAIADRPAADVAAELGLSDGALRQLLLRARTALRAAATAITPYPIVGWLSAGQDIGVARVAEVTVGTGGAGLGLKAGAAVLAAGAVVAGAPALRDEHAPARAAHATTTQTPRPAAATPVDDQPWLSPARAVNHPSSGSRRGVSARGGGADDGDGRPSGRRRGSRGPSGSGSRRSGHDSHGRDERRSDAKGVDDREAHGSGDAESHGSGTSGPGPRDEARDDGEATDSGSSGPDSDQEARGEGGDDRSSGPGSGDD